MNDLYTARQNLAMLERCPTWYEHEHAIHAAMQTEQEAWNVRRDYGWDGDEGGEWGPNPLQPGETILASDWEDELALSFPEDFSKSDRYVYELMEVIGKYKDDPAVMAHMVALRAADYLGNLGQPDVGTIRGQLRTSYVITSAEAAES